MNFYFKRENVELYKSLMNEYDNGYVLTVLKEYLPFSSFILELGMGTGNDLLELSKQYNVLGTDFSPLFIEDFKTNHPDINVQLLNAITVEIEATFDCIYSNKVLQHLSVTDFKSSLKNQATHLNTNGLIFMTLWYGNFPEEYDENTDMRCIYYTDETIKNCIPNNLFLKKINRYTEAEENDSILVVLQKKV